MQNTNSKEQNQLIAELSTSYGIEPEEVIFFAGDPRPIFSYEAGCVVANALADLADIDMNRVESKLANTVSFKCSLVLPNGKRRSAEGSANVYETDNDGHKLSTAQIEELARGRAFRNALRVAGIDLLKLHNMRVNGVVEFSGPPRNLKENLLRRVHALGTEAGLIMGDDKTAWANIMANLFGGTRHSNELDVSQLEAFAATLETLVPRTGQRAA